MISKVLPARHGPSKPLSGQIMMHRVRMDIKTGRSSQLNTSTGTNMDNTVPDLSSQLTNLDAWLHHNPSSSNTLTLTLSDSVVLHSNSAMLINELFCEHIVPNIGHVINGVGSHVPGHYSGLPLNHDQLENPSEALQPVVPIQLVDDDHITRTFAAQHRGMSFNSNPLLLHTTQLMIISSVCPSSKQCRTVQLDAPWRYHVSEVFFWCRYPNIMAVLWMAWRDVWWVHHQHVWLAFASWGDKLQIL